MKKVSTLSKYALIGVFLCFCIIAEAQDFKIQHIQDDVARTGGTNTSFAAVSSTANAFAMPTNNRKTHAGRSDGDTAAREGDDMAGARVLTGTGTLTYYREGASDNNNMRFNTDIWEYIGTPGGANEFIVRGRYAANLNGVNFVNIDVSGAGITTPNKVVPIITGIMNDDTTNGADSATGIAHLTTSSNLIVRKGTTSNNVTIYITLVEFTGSNWTVLHGDTTSTSNTGSITLYDGYDATGTATNVSSWSNSLIFTQSKAQTAASGGEMEKIRSQWPLMAPGSDNQTVDWSWDATRVTTGNSNRHFIHVLNNPDITVTRFTDSSFAAGETTIDITSAGLTDLAQSSIIGSFITAGNGTGYAQGYRNYYLNSTTQAAHWCAKDGNAGGVSHNIQIIDFVTVPPTTTQGPGGVVAEIELWLKANEGVEQATSVAAVDTDPVLNWLDNSVRANDAVQTTPLNKPIFTENGLNYNPTIDFDGTNHEMTASTTANDSITIFAVGENTYVSNNKNIINLNSGGGGSVVVEQNTITNLRGRYYDGSGASGIVNTPTANSTPFLVEYKHLANDFSELFNAGVSQGTTLANPDVLAGTLTAYIGGHPIDPTKRWDGGIAELIVYNQALTAPERDKVESYLAIKYGFTLGVNGTSQDYVDSDNRVIWDQSANAGYNYNVTGIGKDDASSLEQKQSRTVNTTDDITVGIKDIAATNATNTRNFFADKTFLIWGHDNGSTTAGTDITKDFSSGTSVTSSVTATPIQRIWKMVVTDSVPTIKLSIPKSMVSDSNAGGEEYIMIISDDATFTTNLTSATMEDTGSDLEVDFYIEGTKYITFGSTPITTVGDRAATFDRTDKYISAGDVNDLANTDYTISAWVKRDVGSGKFDVISKRNYFGENTDLDPGTDADGYYNHGYSFRINKDNKFRMVWRDPSDPSNNIMQTSATIPENEWHHIAASFNVATNMVSLYIDGYLEDSDDTLDPMQVPSDAHFIIGAAHHIKRQQKLGGTVDEVRVWNVTLSGDQIRYIMNQEIEENGALNADGKILPSATTKNEIVSIPWNNLIAYYPMNRLVFGSIKDESNSGNDASMINYDLLDEQTAPLPYQTTQDGNWDDDTTWLNGDVQYLPGVDSYLDAQETIDYNIVEISHNVTMDNTNTSLIPANRNGNRTVLGLVVNSGADLQLDGFTPLPGVIPPPGFSTPTGNALTVSHYLKLDGTIDLEGESQLIQTEDSDLDVTSSGTLERDQQGTKDFYTYNYWSSPVGLPNILSNNATYRLSDNILMNGTTTATPNNITFSSATYNGSISGTDITIADYWIWKFDNKTTDDYSSWQHVRSSGQLKVGEGFTMKGVEDTGGTITDLQNYAFRGKPNNGDIDINISVGSDYLVGNPYPSAIDADEFIKDNISSTDTAGARNSDNVINGTLYFWDHFAANTHYLAEYQGGYATYTLMGTAVAVSSDSRIDATGAVGTKVPGRYIPVGQGFFVSATLDASLVGVSGLDPEIDETVDGGTLQFKNSQRAFEIEGGASSVFLKNSNTKKETIAKSSNDVRQKIKLMFNSPKGYHRQLLVGVDENASNGIDLGYDGVLIENNKEDMFWTISNNAFIIQAVDNFNPEQVLPLAVKIDKAGLASINLDALENISADLNIYLRDNELNVTHNLRETEYEVFLASGDYLNRFEVVFQNNLALDINELEDNRLQVLYSNEKQRIVLHNPNSKNIESIEVYNILGQSVLNIQEPTSEIYLEYKAQQITTGAYIIKIKTDEGALTKKILAN
jgi:hypothetical protein